MSLYFCPFLANFSHFLPKPRQPKASVSLEVHKHLGSPGWQCLTLRATDCILYWNSTNQRHTPSIPAKEQPTTPPPSSTAMFLLKNTLEMKIFHTPMPWSVFFCFVTHLICSTMSQIRRVYFSAAYFQISGLVWQPLLSNWPAAYQALSFLLQRETGRKDSSQLGLP